MAPLIRLVAPPPPRGERGVGSGGGGGRAAGVGGAFPIAWRRGKRRRRDGVGPTSRREGHPSNQEKSNDPNCDGGIGDESACGDVVTHLQNEDCFPPLCG